jgi:hypothetical protein
MPVVRGRRLVVLAVRWHSPCRARGVAAAAGTAAGVRVLLHHHVHMMLSHPMRPCVPPHVSHTAMPRQVLCPCSHATWHTAGTTAGHRDHMRAIESMKATRTAVTEQPHNQQATSSPGNKHSAHAHPPPPPPPTHTTSATRGVCVCVRVCVFGREPHSRVWLSTTHAGRPVTRHSTVEAAHTQMVHGQPPRVCAAVWR